MLRCQSYHSVISVLYDLYTMNRHASIHSSIENPRELSASYDVFGRVSLSPSPFKLVHSIPTPFASSAPPYPHFCSELRG